MSHQSGTCSGTDSCPLSSKMLSSASVYISDRTSLCTSKTVSMDTNDSASLSENDIFPGSPISNVTSDETTTLNDVKTSPKPDSDHFSTIGKKEKYSLQCKEQMQSYQNSKEPVIGQAVEELAELSDLFKEMQLNKNVCLDSNVTCKCLLDLELCKAPLNENEILAETEEYVLPTEQVNSNLGVCKSCKTFEENAEMLIKKEQIKINAIPEETLITNYGKTTNINELYSQTELTQCKSQEVNNFTVIDDNKTFSESSISSDEDYDQQSTALSDQQLSKIVKINSILQDSVIDVATLQDLAIHDDGFVTDSVRRCVWPRLLHVESELTLPLLSRHDAEQHQFCAQVVLDVERTLKRFPPGISARRRRLLMDQLIRVIVTVLQRHPDLHYYQGYHDVGITLLLVCGESKAVLMLECLSLTHLRQYLQPCMAGTQQHLAYLYPVLAQACPDLHRHMISSGVGTVFCLAWLITWYAHTLHQYRQVVRLYDVLLASPPLMPMYVAAALLRYRQDDLLQVECDMAMMHHALSQVPEELPLDRLLKEAHELYRLMPPHTLAGQVDLYMQDQREREEAEQRECKRRSAAARARREAAAQPWWLPWWLPRAVAPRTARALAVVALAAAVALYWRGGSRMLPLPW